MVGDNADPALQLYAAGGFADLIDAIIGLQVLTDPGATNLVRGDYTSSGVDVDGGGKVGLPEVLHGLQKEAEVRPQ